MNDTAEYFVDAVVFRKNGDWIAQAVDYDLNVSAPALSTLPTLFMEAVGAEVSRNTAQGEEPLSTLPRAAAAFRQMFEKGTVTLAADERFVYVGSNGFANMPRIVPRFRLAK